MAYDSKSHNPARLCGWSNQGDQRQDREAKEIHERVIYRGINPPKAKKK